MNVTTAQGDFMLKLRDKLQATIVEAGKVEGVNEFVLNNALVVSVLLDMAAAYSAMHSFRGYGPEKLVKGYSESLLANIKAYRRAISQGVPIRIVPLDDIH